MFLSRTIYNIFAISVNSSKIPDFGYDWINVSDQADLVNLTEFRKYFAFTLILLIWEVIPISVVMVLFRIKRNQRINYQATKCRKKLPIVGKSRFLDAEVPTDSSDERNEEANENDALINDASTSYDSDDNSYRAISRYQSINASNEPILNVANKNYEDD